MLFLHGGARIVIKDHLSRRQVSTAVPVNAHFPGHARSSLPRTRQWRAHLPQRPPCRRVPTCRCSILARPQRPHRYSGNEALSLLVGESVHNDCGGRHVRGGHEAVAPLAAAAGARAQPSNQQATDSLGEDRRVGFRRAAPHRALKTRPGLTYP
jgi:hypothetical protein